MRVIETKVFQIEEHPNRDAVYNWIRDNWHDLGEWCLLDMIESLKVFADTIGANNVDYSLSIVPDRGEYIKFNFTSDIEPKLESVLARLDLSGNCPLTGVCYDEDILDALRNCDKRIDSLRDVLRTVEANVLRSLHSEGEYLYSDEGLFDLCEANGYEFTESGEIV